MDVDSMSKHADLLNAAISEYDVDGTVEGHDPFKWLTFQSEADLVWLEGTLVDIVGAVNRQLTVRITGQRKEKLRAEIEGLRQSNAFDNTVELPTRQEDGAFMLMDTFPSGTPRCRKLDRLVTSQRQVQCSVSANHDGKHVFVDEQGQAYVVTGYPDES